MHEATSMRRPRILLITTFACLCAVAISAAQLTSEAMRAYETYLKNTKEAFLSRIRTSADAPATAETEQPARPGKDSGIIRIPGGLVHHWMGGILIPHATLERVVDVSASYANYHAIYKEVIASRVVAHDGDTYHVVLRLKEGEAGLTAVLDVHSTIQYVRPTDGLVYSISLADEIREVEHAGQPSERLLPAGRDSGYLWRACNLTVFRERGDGVWVEAESLGLTRRFPAFSAWFIEPIARRLGRKSIDASLQEFALAVRKAV
jgi:hypothetical protein